MGNWNIENVGVKSFNNQFMRQRAYVEILREVWRARKRRKSCTRRSKTSQVLTISRHTHS